MNLIQTLINLENGGQSVILQLAPGGTSQYKYGKRRFSDYFQSWGVSYPYSG